MTEENPYACWERKCHPVVCEICLRAAYEIGSSEAAAYMRIAELYNAVDRPVISYCDDKGSGFPALDKLEHHGFVVTTEGGFHTLFVKPHGFEDNSRAIPMHISCKKDHLVGK